MAAPRDVSAELSKLLEDSPVPGLVAAAVLNGEIVATGAAGIRKLGAPEKVTIADRFHLGSCTKSMTATLGAMLVEEGKLKWDTRPGEVFEKVAIHEGYREVTLRHLLSNTGGVPHEVDGKLWAELWKREGEPREQRMLLVRGMLGKEPSAKPGERDIYSNAGFAIAGAMMEVKSGEPYEQLITRRLFEPLGIRSAGFGAPATPGKVDQPYGHRIGGAGLEAIDPQPHGDNPPGIAPAGTVHMTVSDFARYAAFHLGAGPKDLLKPETLALLHEPTPVSDYALGWKVVERDWAGGTALTHIGTNTMFHAVIWLAPEKGFGAVAMSNHGGKEGFTACDQAVAALIELLL